MRGEENQVSFMFICFFAFNFSIFFLNFLFYFKGDIICYGRKSIKYTDSYDVIDLRICYVKLLFRCYYSIDSSVDYQGFVLFQRFSFNYRFCSPGSPTELIRFH